MDKEKEIVLREAQYLSTPVYEQAEFDAISDHESFVRHKEAMAMRWFGYYRKCQDQQKKMKLIDQYNFLAQTRKER